MSNKIILPLVAIAVLGFGVFTAKSVFAQQDAASFGGSRSSLIQRISARFGLNEEDVKAVFDEDRQEHQQEMQSVYEEKLSQYVSENKITAEQKQLILAKHEELMSRRQSNADLTAEERRAQMEQERAELKSWAEDNGIDIPVLGGFGMDGHGRFLGRGFSAGEDSSTNQ